MENAELYNNPLSIELKEKIALGNQYAFRQLFQLYSKVLLITRKLPGASTPDEVEEQNQRK